MADKKLSDLTELTAPASDDEFLVLDTSESVAADKNKRISYGTLLTEIPAGSVTAPSLGFADDSDATGFFRSAEDEIAISTGDALNSKFTTTGFQVGSGTAAAQFHTFKATTGDDVIIENSNAGALEGPNVVFYRNSASPAADDVLGTLEFRGEDDAGSAQSYAEVTASIVDASSGSEDGRLDFVVTKAGAAANVLRLQEGKAGINEPAPESPLHITDGSTEAVRLECANDDAASGADIRMYRHRDNAVGQDNDELSTLYFRGNNDDGTQSQRPIDYAAIQAVIADASNTTEDGRLRLQVQTAGTLTTQIEVSANAIGFFGATAAAQPTAIANLAVATVQEQPLWTPAALGGNLKVWLKADDSSTISGSSVSQWNDKSGNGNHATQSSSGNQPASGSSTINSKNVIDFAGGKHMTLGYPPSLDRTIAVVAQYDGISGLKTVVGARDSTNERSYLGQNTGVSRIGVGEQQSLSGNTIATSTTYIQVLKHGEGVSGRQADHYLDGVQDIDSTFASTTSIGSSNNYMIGGFNDAGTIHSSRYGGLMAELVITDKIMSDEDRQRLEGYLAHEWGTTGSLPSDHPYKTAAPRVALPAANGSITIADAGAPSSSELLKYCVELETKLESALAALRTLGLIAS